MFYFQTPDYFTLTLVLVMSFASCSPASVAEKLFLIQQKKKADALVKKQAAFIARQQDKMDNGALLFDPGHQVTVIS